MNDVRPSQNWTSRLCNSPRKKLCLPSAKNWRLQDRENTFELLEYPQDESLCVVSHLKQYIKCTEQLRAAQHTRLLISHSKPHKPVTNFTVGKWAKTVIREAGIDTSKFSGNSARPTSTSYGASKKSLKQAVGLMLRHLLSIITNLSKGILEPAYLHVTLTWGVFAFIAFAFYTIVTQCLFCYLSGLHISAWHM